MSGEDQHGVASAGSCQHIEGASILGPAQVVDDPGMVLVRIVEA